MTPYTKQGATFPTEQGQQLMGNEVELLKISCQHTSNYKGAERALLLNDSAWMVADIIQACIQVVFDYSHVGNMEAQYW